jgi:putative nucleotidyltransferase with HDIG domain
MDRLCFISDSVEGAGHIGRHLLGIFDTQCLPRRDLLSAKPAKHIVVDIDLADASYLFELKLWLARRPKDGRALFAVERGVRREAVQAYAMGATDLLERPLDRMTLLTKLLGDMEFPVGNSPDFSMKNSDGVLSAIEALQSIFDSVGSGSPVELKSAHSASGAVVSNIEADGLAHWIGVVRTHHNQTYQHCLLVTGVAAAFGRHLGFSSKDKQKLALAGLLHDLGKAGIPIGILEKSGPLDDDETEIMKRHPLLGVQALRGVQGLDPDMLDMVAHHHEYLDGSGYPHGLHAGDISDLVRLMTISDIYGALIERRSYKAPLPCKAAFQVLENMGPKLDMALVRQFQSFARTHTE